MSYKFSISDKGSNSKGSNTWTNSLKYATELAKNNIGNVITVKCNKGHFSESFVWSINNNDIIPAF
jgi:hypothetical protein